MTQERLRERRSMSKAIKHIDSMRDDLDTEVVRFRNSHPFKKRS